MPSLCTETDQFEIARNPLRFFFVCCKCAHLEPQLTAHILANFVVNNVTVVGVAVLRVASLGIIFFFWLSQCVHYSCPELFLLGNCLLGRQERLRSKKQQFRHPLSNEAAMLICKNSAQVPFFFCGR